MKKGWIEMPLVKLRTAPWNYKVKTGFDDASKFAGEKLANSLEKRGVIKNLIVRDLGKGNFEVIDGNHRLEELIKQSVKNVMCYNMGKISIDEARVIALEVNEIAFKSNEDKLAKMLDGLAKKIDPEELNKTIPFTTKELSKFHDKFKQSLQPQIIEVPDATQGKATGPKGGSSGEFVKITIHVPRKMAQRFYDIIERFKFLCYPAEKPEDIKIIEPFERMIKITEKCTDSEIKKA